MRRRLSRVLAAGLSATLALAGPAQAATPRNLLLEVKRDPVFNPDTLLADFRQARALLSITSTRLAEARAERREVPLDRADVSLLVAQMALTNVELLVEAKSWNQASADLDIAARKIREAQLLLMPSRPVEGRGMILDSGSIPHTREDIAALMAKLADANFNFVVPEVFLRGYAIYPSRVAELDPAFRGLPFDVLQVLIDEAHQRGLEVHPWIWTFRVRSPAAGAEYGNPVLERLPALTAGTGTVPGRQIPPSAPPSQGGTEVAASPSPGPPAPAPSRVVSGRQAGVEDNFITATPQFMSPASPEARRFVLLLLRDMASRYAIDGLLLDYIRYDETITSDAVSQTAFRLDYFEKHGAWPPEPLEPGAPEYAEWQVWRELQVGAMVAAASTELKRVRKDLTLSAAVFRSEVYARLNKMQNWRHWADNGWVDFVGPMLYTSDAADLDTWLDWETNNSTRDDLLYPILGAIRFKDINDLYAQIDVLQQRNVPGLDLFSLTHVNRLSQTVFQDLKLGPFRNIAYAPHRGLVRALARVVDGLGGWVRDVAREPAVNDDELLNVGVALQKMERGLPQGEVPLRDPAAYTRYLRELHEDALKRFRAKGLPASAQAELRRRFGYAEELLRAYEARRARGRNYMPPAAPPTNVLPETVQLPAAAVRSASTAPEIDGHLDDTTWQYSPEVERFYWNTGASRAQVTTTVRFFHDARNLYVAFSNAEPNMDRIKSFDNTRNSGKLFAADDTVEIFLQATAGGPYFHFAVNAGNTQFLQRIANGNFQKLDRNWRSAVYQRPDGWDVEIAIPWSVLEASAPGPGDRWRGNACRDRQQEVNPFSCWSATYGSYHTPKRFGVLQF